MASEDSHLFLAKWRFENGPFLLIVRTGRIVTAHATP